MGGDRRWQGQIGKSEREGRRKKWEERKERERMVTAERKGGKHGGKEAMREDRMGGGKKKYASTLKKPHGKMLVAKSPYD